MQVGLLGPLTVVGDDGVKVRVPGAPKERAVLAVLGLRAGIPVGVRELTDALWGDGPPVSAPKTLQTYVSALRRRLPAGAISTVGAGYRLNVDVDTVDVFMFQHLVAAGQRALAAGDAEASVGSLRQALGLWRGDPLVELADQPWGIVETARLMEGRRHCQELLAEARLAVGEAASLVGDLEAAAAAEPLRERRWAQLMLALYRAGRQADALRAFQRLRAQLADQLGIEPSAELRALDDAILLQKPELDRPTTSRPAEPTSSQVRACELGGQIADGAPVAPTTFAARGLVTFMSSDMEVGEGTFPPLQSLGADPNNLPAPRSVFIGRRRELAAIAGLVRSARLVTLTGVGGVGKTRLALSTAAGLVGEFPGGVWLVELAPLIDSALVAATVAAALGLSVAGGVDSTEAVCRFLAHRRALVVVDNCEHVIGAAAALVDRVLAAGPQVRVLATSRESLEIPGESAWRVPSLSLDADGDAVALFAERAAHAQPGFSLDNPATAESALAVCRRLDGIPLAIELAAARAKVLSVGSIAAHLDERFRLLTRGSRTAVARQQTLRGAIGWSYELLSPQEQELFDSLGVFAGEFDLHAAASVASLDELEALDLVEQLVNKSMVEADPSRDRYRLLETLRQYAWGRLGTTDRLGEVRSAHAACFSALAAQQARRMVEGGQSGAALDRLEADYDNLRAALAWLIEQRRAAAAARMVRRLSSLFNVRHPREGFGWCQQVVAMGGVLPAKVRARLLADTAWAAWYAGDFEASARYAGDAVEVGGDDAPARIYWILGNLAFVRGDLVQAVDHLQRAILGAGTQQGPRSEAMANGMLALVRAELGEEGEARRLVTEAIGLAERLGEPTILAVTYDTAAAALAQLGSAIEAVTIWDQGLVYLDAAGPILACVYRSSYALRLNDPCEAARILGNAIPIAKDQLSGLHQAQPLLPAATIAAATGRHRIAAQLLSAFNHYGAGMATLRVGRESEHLADRLQERLGGAIAEEEFARGARLTIVHALQLAEDTVNATLRSRQQ